MNQFTEAYLTGFHQKQANLMDRINNYRLFSSSDSLSKATAATQAARFGLSRAILGGIAGAGIGAATGERDPETGKKKRGLVSRMLIGGLTGTAIGGIAGAGAGAVRGHFQGKGLYSELEDSVRAGEHDSPSEMWRQLDGVKFGDRDKVNNTLRWLRESPDTRGQLVDRLKNLKPKGEGATIGVSEVLSSLASPAGVTPPAEPRNLPPRVVHETPAYAEFNENGADSSDYRVTD